MRGFAGSSTATPADVRRRNPSIARNARTRVSCTRSSASAGRPVIASATRYSTSIYGTTCSSTAGAAPLSARCAHSRPRQPSNPHSVIPPVIVCGDRGIHRVPRWVSTGVHPVCHLLLSPRIGPYLDGELDPAMEARVRAHVRECWRCSGELELQLGTGAALRQRRAAGPPSLAVTRLRHFALSAPRNRGPRAAETPSGRPDPRRRGPAFRVGSSSVVQQRRRHRDRHAREVVDVTVGRT